MKSKYSASESKLLKDDSDAWACWDSIWLCVFCAVMFTMDKFVVIPVVADSVKSFYSVFGFSVALVFYFVMHLLLSAYYSLAKPADDINSKTERKENEK